MKKVFSQIEYVFMLIFVLLSFFPWIGFLNHSGIDITKSVFENITSVASVEYYAIAVTVTFAVVSLVLVLMQKAVDILPTIAFVSPMVAFAYGMINTNGKYLSSMELAYIIVVVLSVLILLKKFGIIKLK